MRKLFIIGALLGIGYYAFGTKKTGTQGAPIIQPGTIGAELPTLEGKAVQVDGGTGLFLVKNGQLWSYSSWESYLATGSPEIVKISTTELDALGSSVGGIDTFGKFFNY